MIIFLHLLSEIMTERVRYCEILISTFVSRDSNPVDACLHKAFCWKVENLVEKLARRFAWLQLSFQCTYVHWEGGSHALGASNDEQGFSKPCGQDRSEKGNYEQVFFLKPCRVGQGVKSWEQAMTSRYFSKQCWVGQGVKN